MKATKPETTEPTKKEMQAAIKDINKVLEPEPKLVLIATDEDLGRQIIDAVAVCVGTDDEGNPIWVNPVGANLSPATIATYEALVMKQAADTPAQGPELTVVQPVQEEASTEELAECPAFVQGLGPKAGDAECEVCAKLVECEAKVQPPTKPAETPKKGKKKKVKGEVKAREEKPVKTVVKKPVKDTKKYTRVQATCEALQDNANKPKTLDFFVQSAHKKYVAQGGPDDIKVAKRATEILFSGLIILGHLVKNEDNTFTYVG